MTNQPPLRSNPSFRGFVGAQFLGAFNDNLYKQLILLLAVGVLFPGADKQGLAFAVFSLPFILFGGIAGELSERFSKSQVMVLMKVVEIGIMGLGVFALHLRDWNAMLAVLFAMGTHSAFFGPCKYGGMPEMVNERDLLFANSLVAMTTFLSVLLGESLAGFLMDELGANLWQAALPCVVFACIGLGFALTIRKLPAQRPTLRLSLNPFAGMGHTLGTLWSRPALFAVVIGMSLFWFNGGVLSQAVNGLAAPDWLDIGEGEKAQISKLRMWQSLAIVLGCLAAGPVARRVKPSLVIFGGAVTMFIAQCGLLLVGTVLTASGGAYVWTGLCLVLAGFAGALFFVPVNAYLQTAMEEGDRGRAFAANNTLNFVFIFLSGAFYALREALGVSPAIATAAAGFIMVLYLFRARTQLGGISFVK